jgi:hypothetical protein
MGFITKVDYSNGRQVKQYPKTITPLSGTTVFGVNFSALTSGPNPSTSGTVATYSNVVSYFSGDTGSTAFIFGDKDMVLGTTDLVPITSSNSGTTQFGGPDFTGTSYTLIDGNRVNLTYTGITFNLNVNQIIATSPTTFSGNILSTVVKYSADSLDYSGRTIWSDVKGLTRADVIILNQGLVKGDEDVSVSAKTNSVILGGSGNTFTDGVKNAVILGTSGITATTSDFAYTNNLKITNKLGINRIPQYSFDLQSNSGRVYYDNSTAELPYLQLSGSSDSMPFIGTTEKSASAGTVIGVRGGTNGLYPAYGKVLDSFLYSTVAANGINIISAPGTGTEDYIRLYAGQQANAGLPDLHVQGSGATRGYVGVGTDSPTKLLDINGEVRIRTIGAGPGTTDLGVDANGNVVNQASDKTLKENIEIIQDGLLKVLNLSGVTYNWKDRENGGDNKKYGFIAQDVESVIPELTFQDRNNGLKGVYYKEMTALLVEAIKELSNKITLLEDEINKLKNV